MRLSGRVALGGVQLDEVDPSVVIRSIDPGTPQEDMSAVAKMGGWGMRITSQHWKVLEVKVVFAINIPKTKMAERRRVFDAVKAWANQTGWLTVNWMTGKRVYIDKTVFESSGNMWEWTNEYTITFRAYNIPFWRDATSTKAANKTAAKSGDIAIEMGGDVPGVLAATFENKSGQTINNITITVKKGSDVLSQMAFGNLNLGGSDSLVIDHRTDGLLRIRKKSGSTYTSVYDKLTGSDDLYTVPGALTVSFTADRSGILTVSGTGRYV